MGTPISRRRVRLWCDMASDGQVIDALLGGQAHIWRGADVAFEVGLAREDVAVDDFSNLASVTMKLLASDRATLLASKTVAAGSLSGAATKATFDAGTAQSGTFTFTGEELTWDLGGELRADFWLVVIGTVSAGDEITYGCGPITMEEDGSSASGIAPEVGLLAVIDDSDSPYTVTAGKQTVLVDTTTAAVTVNLPAAPVDGQIVKIKDSGGAAATNAITVSGNGNTIDGQASAELADNWAAMTVQYSAVLDGWYQL